MDLLGFEPTHGPDPSRADDQFEYGGAWFVVIVLPLRLPYFPAVYLFGSGQPILGTFYEVLGGSVALRFDPRWQLLVLRRHPPYWGRRGWRVVHAEVGVTEDAVCDRRQQLVARWPAQPFVEAPALTRRQRLEILRGGRPV